MVHYVCGIWLFNNISTLLLLFSFVRARTVANIRKALRDQVVLAEMKDCFVVTNATAVQTLLYVKIMKRDYERVVRTEDVSLEEKVKKKIWQITYHNW